MKKVLSIIICLVLTVSLAACRKTKNDNTEAYSSAYNQEATSSSFLETTSEVEIIEDKTQSDLQEEPSQPIKSELQTPTTSTTSQKAESVREQPNPEPPPQTENTSTQSAADILQLLNTVSLSPQITNFSPLDNLIEEIFAQIHTAGMSTGDKVKACYDYLVNNCSYQTPFYFGNSLGLIYSSAYDEMLVMNSHYILSTKTGVCDNYSAAFAVMCRKIGLNAHVAGGTVSKKGGGRTGHAWAYIIINDTPYIFDPQVQSNNPQATYYYFGKTYAQMGSTYEIDSNSYSSTHFGNFECYEMPPMDMKVELNAVGAEGKPPFTHTHEQAGSSSTMDLSGLEGIVAKADGTVDLTVTPTGGSGKYLFVLLAVNGDTEEETVICEKETTTTEVVTINYNLYKDIPGVSFAVIIIDALNQGSYLIEKNLGIFTIEEYQKELEASSIDVTLNLISGDYTNTLNAKNSGCHLTSYFITQVNTNQDGKLKIESSITGASGQYTISVFAVDKNLPDSPETLIITQEVGGSGIVIADFSAYKGKGSIELHIEVEDKQNDDAAIAFRGMEFI